MTTRTLLSVSLLLLCCFMKAQTVSHVYKISDLLRRIDQPDTTYVVNFWARWCKPCIAELPAFDSLNTAMKGSAVKVLLVSLDFKEDLETKVNPFLKQRNIKAECVLLDEINGNDFVDKIAKSWTGAIPATYFKGKAGTKLVEQKINLKDLKAYLSGLK